MANAGRRPAPWAPLAPDGDLSYDELERTRSYQEPSRWLVSPDVDAFEPIVEAASVATLMSVIAATARHDYFLCSARAKRMLALGNDGLRFAPNLWLGVPVGSDEDIWRVEDLLRCNTAHPWVLVDDHAGALDRLPVAMLALVVTAGAGVGRLAERCRAAAVGYEVW